MAGWPVVEGCLNAENEMSPNEQKKGSLQVCGFCSRDVKIMYCVEK